MAHFINSTHMTHLREPSPMWRRSGGLPPRPPGEGRCGFWSFALAQLRRWRPLSGACIGGESPSLVSSFPFFFFF